MLRWHCKPELRLLKLGRIIALTIALGFYSPAVAECDLGEVVGWTLIAEKTVEGYVEDGKRDDSYEGCDFDRVLIFTDNTAVRCAEYEYSYAYRPTAYIFANGSLLKACIDDDWIDIWPLR
ncbi:hypothetical protein HRJ34_26055 [Rhizorhabdus wittichii]|uniref:Uncharacterized protein n=1 Tax=Rhizorhabdus wittichii TaxID=160791 RepID=A0A975HDS4_9SPHN|nr:hypothetical protein [Rhizorhabdus wittichii]QTH21721.1 hypothetical protein HRJ34_26055 [Rhizorhabdus wittichii]